MQTTSTTWRSLWQSGSAKLEARVTIAGTVYTDPSAPVIARALMQDGLSAGNAVSASCAFSLRAPGQIPKAAQVIVEARLTDGETASEWLPAGTFYISRRSLDPVTGRLSLECYDALLKANAVWEPSAGSWPRSMAAVAAELAALIGVAQDPRNALDSGLTMDEPTAGATVRDVLGGIAAAHGGNWIISPAGKLRLVPLTGSADVAEVPGVLGRMSATSAQAITGVRCETEDGTFLAGDETGAVVTLLGDCAAARAAELLAAWSGGTWQAFELSGALVDPAAELGDSVTAGAGGEVDGVLCGQTATLGTLFRCELRAPGPAEVADEYPYIGAAAKALTVAKAYAETVSAEAAEALDSALTQLEIFNRLTGNGAAQGLYFVDGQLYVNASYIRTGTLTLGGLNNVNGVMQVLDASGNVIGTWNREGIQISSGSLKFNYSNGDYCYVNRNAIPIDIKTTTDSGYTYTFQVRKGEVYLFDATNDHKLWCTPLGIHLSDWDDSYFLDINANGVYLNNKLFLGVSTTDGRAQLVVGSRSANDGYIEVNGNMSVRELSVHQVTGRINASNGSNGTFATADGKTVTVTNGIITGID